MHLLITLLIIAISLSLDAFSVALVISMYKINKKKMLLFATLVGIMHFFMPIIGFSIGNKIINYLNINANILLGIILLFITFEIIINNKNNDNNISLNIISLFILSLSVSFDSFSIGIGIVAIDNRIIMISTIFCLTAFLITLIGLIIGKYSSKLLGNYANDVSIVLLIILSIFFIFK